jgi:hypothetical protein
MQEFGPFAVAISVFVFLAIASVAGVIGDYKKRRIALEPLRAAIERGQQIDPAVIERLMAPEERNGPDPLALQVGGIITIASGVGVAALGYFLAHVSPIALYPLLGIGLVIVCVGIGLLIAARVAQRHVQNSRGNGSSGT